MRIELGSLVGKARFTRANPLQVGNVKAVARRVVHDGGREPANGDESQ